MDNGKRFVLRPGSEMVMVCLTLALICLAVYGKTLFFGVTNADDEVMITGNLPFLRNLANIPTVFTTDAFYLHREIDLYRPLQSLTYILDAQWGGDTVFFVHLTNVVLHFLCCLVVYRLLIKLEFCRSVAFTGALIYAVHYLFMTAVAWIPARGDLLLALFTFLALLLLVKSLEAPGWPAISLHLLFFTLALFSKESAIVLPLLFAVYLWTHGRTASLGRRHLLLPLWYLGAITAYWVLKNRAVADSTDERGLVSFLKNLHLLPEMVAKFYIPVNMSTLPAYTLSSTLCGAALIAVLCALPLMCARLRQRRAIFYPCWVLLFILPGLTYYPNFYSFSNEHVDHRAYLVCFGLLLLNLQVLQRFSLHASRYFKPAVGIVLVYLAGFNLHFSENYRNPEAFALQAIRHESNSALAFTNYGTEKFLQGDELEALRYLNRALRIVPKFMPALHYRARIFANRGMYREALSDLDTLLVADPDYDADDYLLRGQMKMTLHDYPGAAADFTEALRLNPDHGGALEGARTLRDAGLFPRTQGGRERP
jgi:hypothetical protein